MVKKTASEIIEELQLIPLDEEGGYFKRSIRDCEYSSIYYLMTDESFSAMHKLVGFKELWCFLDGDEAVQMQISPKGECKEVSLGSPLKGYSAHTMVEKDYWQGTKLVEGGKWALFFITVLPAFNNTCFVLADENNFELYGDERVEKYLPRNNKCML